MSKMYLKSSAGCGKKIIKNWGHFHFQNLVVTDAEGHAVAQHSAKGDYSARVNWSFDNQEGVLLIDFSVSSNGKKTYKEGSTINTLETNKPLYRFDSPLGYYNDDTLKAVFDRIV